MGRVTVNYGSVETCQVFGRRRIPRAGESAGWTVPAEVDEG